MDEEYKKAEAAYKAIVKRLISENTEVVGSIPRNNSYRRSAHFARDKSVIPFIEPDPKTSFLTITQRSIFTKDDPILRYVPAIKTSAPTSICWYEGISVGETQLSATDTINELFLKSKSMYGESARRAYLKSVRRAKIEIKTRTPQPGGSMEANFCNVCRVFGCKMHRTQEVRIIKDTESQGCDCGQTGLPPLAELGYSNIAILRGLSLKKCVLNRLGCVLTGTKQNHGAMPKTSIPMKTVKKGLSSTNFKTFHNPCQHAGACVPGNCPCAKRHRSCEGSCGCTNCKNIIFCKCNGCDENCPCFINHRECTDLCKCTAGCDQAMPKIGREIPLETLKMMSGMSIYLMKPDDFVIRGNKLQAVCRKPIKENTDIRGKASARRESDGAKNSPKCRNRNTQQGECRELVIRRSVYHGYGLFAEEFVRKGDYVIEYTGEIISDKEAERRGNFYELNKCSYLFDLAFENDECLYSTDAFFMGNKSRYINHSSSRANLKARALENKGMPKIAFYASCDIYPGEELFFDYHFSEDHKAKHGILD